jgi:simple sugar transport system permease protein
VLLSGALAGLGGVWLCYDQHGFVAGMSAGRGFIALAAMILGGWTPLGALAACLLFGGAEALELRLQASAASAHGAGLVQSLPYLVTIATLALRARRQVAPAALGRPT